MIKRGIFMGVALYLALLLFGVAFNACGKSGEKSDNSALGVLMLMGGKASYFVTIPEGAAY